MLDRGERAEWFGSTEIIVECALALLFGWIFLVHSLTKDRPFLDPRLLLERNFALGIGISAIFGMLFVTPMVLIPAMLQQLRDLPEFTVGMLIAARGAGTAVSMLMMILFANSWNPRLLFLIGFGLHTYAGLEMASFEMNVSLSEVAWAMGLQGFGVGWLWVPMSLVIFSNLDPRRSAEGAAIVSFRSQHCLQLLHIGEHRGCFSHPENELQRAGAVDQSVQQPPKPAKRDGRLEYREHDRASHASRVR